MLVPTYIHPLSQVGKITLTTMLGKCFEKLSITVGHTTCFLLVSALQLRDTMAQNALFLDDR